MILNVVLTFVGVNKWRHFVFCDNGFDLQICAFLLSNGSSEVCIDISELALWLYFSDSIACSI